MRRRLPLILLAVVAFLSVPVLSGCGTPAPYVGGCAGTCQPPAYGADGHCYYVDDPAEVVALQAAGLCPVNWTPIIMPSPWRSQYAWYYDSPRYYGTYVPPARRTTYITHVHVYESHNPQAQRNAPTTRRASSPATVRYAGNGRQGGDTDRLTRASTSQATRTQTTTRVRNSGSGRR